MAIDRQGTGLAIVRVCLGVFFIAEALSKFRWFMDSSILGRSASPAGSPSPPRGRAAARISSTSRFRARCISPGSCRSASSAAARRCWSGSGRRSFAFIAFLLALNFDFASGQLLRLSFLTNGYGLPVLGPTLGLAIGGVRLPWSIRS